MNFCRYRKKQYLTYTAESHNLQTSCLQTKGFGLSVKTQRTTRGRPCTTGIRAGKGWDLSGFQHLPKTIENYFAFYSCSTQQNLQLQLI